MKNLLIALVILTSIGFVACNNDELNDIERDLSSLQDSLSTVINQHNILLDSISNLVETINASDTTDVEALKISQIGSLFESIARQPELANTLIQATEMLYFDYSELLPFSNKTIEERGIVVGVLFESIARQPEAYNDLYRAASKFLGEFNPQSMSDDFTEGKARGLAYNSLFASIARQPEAYDNMELAAVSLFGEYNPSYFSNELIDVSKAYSMTGLNEGLARQPEADIFFNHACIKFFNYDFLNEE